MGCVCAVFVRGGLAYRMPHLFAQGGAGHLRPLRRRGGLGPAHPAPPLARPFLLQPQRLHVGEHGGGRRVTE